MNKHYFAICALLIFLAAPLLASAQAAPSIALEMTIAEDTGVDECGVSDNVLVPAGATVRVCYTVTNTGDVALDFHDLVDDQFGTILSNFPLTLAPAGSVWLTQTVVTNEDTTFNATWTAYNEGPTDEAESSDSASATVIPPSIELAMTLAVDTGVDECGVSDTLEVGGGTTVRVCYTVTNTGQTPLDFHDLVDTQLGTMLSNFALTLEPDASVWLTQTYSTFNDTVFEGTWTAYNEGPVNVAESVDSAFLTISYAQVPTLGLPALLLLTGLLGLVAFMHRRNFVKVKGQGLK